MIHVIEIREMVPGGKPGTVKFKSTANLTYNCNKEEFNGHWAVGEKYKIDFNVSKFQGSRGEVEMKWVNNARFWKESDGPVDPPEKPIYKGGGGGGSYSGSSNKGGDMSAEKTHDIHKQVAAKCAMEYFAAANATVEDLAGSFAVVADIVLGYIEAAPKSAHVSGDSVADNLDTPGDPDADIEF